MHTLQKLITYSELPTSLKLRRSHINNPHFLGRTSIVKFWSTSIKMISLDKESQRFQLWNFTGAGLDTEKLVCADIFHIVFNYLWKLWSLTRFIEIWCGQELKAKKEPFFDSVCWQVCTTNVVLNTCSTCRG